MWHVLLGQRDAVDHRREFARSRRCFLEPLEERKLLAILPLAGTAGDDVIDIDHVGDNLVVSVNNIPVYNGPIPGIDTVEIDAGDGHDEVNVNSLPSGNSASPTIPEAEGNQDPDLNRDDGFDDLPYAQDLDSGGWHVDPPGSSHENLIGDDLGDRSGDEHVTVLGSGDGTVDVYAFTVVVDSDPVNVLLDIDNTTGGLDSYLELLDQFGNVLIAGDDGAFTDTGSSSPLDSFISHTFAVPGTYQLYVRVDSVNLLAQPIGSIPVGTTYDLHVVVPGHAIPSGGAIPLVVVNGGNGSDTVNVAAGLMPLSGTEENVLAVGPAPFAGTLLHGLDETASYTSVEAFNGGAAFTVLTDLVTLNQQNGAADTTWVRGNLDGTKLLVDVNGTAYFTGGIDQILIAAVNGSSDADAILVENTAAKAHIDGGAGNDTITTAEANDIIYGGDGDDLIATNGGDDYVAGGADNDTIDGGAGNDGLHGNSGDDVLSGQDGHDLVSGGAGNDKVSGNHGQDVLIGGSGADQVIGNSDRDLLFAAGIIVQVISGPVSLGESDSITFGDDNYFRLQDLRDDWLEVVALTLAFQDFADKYDSGGDDLVEDKLQGGSDDDVFFSDGSARIIDSAFDRETTT